MSDKLVPEKVIRDGKVAVLISYGYGAGWSTWAQSFDHGNNSLPAFILFHKGLVEMAERNAPEEEVEKYLAEGGIIDYVYTGGWSDVKVEWLSQGTHFDVEEYDGNERIRTLEELRYIA